jgi:hypothetical protein
LFGDVARCYSWMGNEMQKCLVAGYTRSMQARGEVKSLAVVRKLCSASTDGLIGWRVCKTLGGA